MWTFGRAVLIGSIGAGEVDGIVVLGEGSEDFGAVAKFATLVHDDVFVGDVRCIASEPAIEPFYRGLLGSASGTLDLATVVVGDGDIAGFAIEASVLFETLGVLGGLDDETEINTESLKTSGGFARIVFAASRFAKLGSEADRAIVDLGGNRELGNAFDELVGVGEAASIAVGETLVPQDALSVARQMKDTEDLVGMGVGQEGSFDISGMRGSGMHLQTGEGGIIVGGRQRGSIQRVSRGRVVRVRGRVRGWRRRGNRRRCRRLGIRRSRSGGGGKGGDGGNFGVVLDTGDVASMDNRAGQRVGVLFVGGSNQRIGIVKTTEKNAGDDEVATTIDGIEDGGKGCATVGVGVDVVAAHVQLALDVAGGHQGGGDTWGVVREDVLVTTVGAGRDLKIAVPNGAMDVAVSSAEDDITALLGVVPTVGMEELELVGGSGLGAVVKMGADF
jgi:hypothetical protein